MAEDTSAAVTQLPASYDFNALHDALAGGAGADEAHETAVIADTVAISADEAASRAIESAAELPSLKGADKAALLAAGEAEGVAYALNAKGEVIPFGEATNPQMAEAIEAKRRGEPILPAASDPE